MFKLPATVLALVLCAAVAVIAVRRSVRRAASAAPTCVVSLSPTATETLFAIGAG